MKIRNNKEATQYTQASHTNTLKCKIQQETDHNDVPARKRAHHEQYQNIAP